MSHAYHFGMVGRLCVRNFKENGGLMSLKWVIVGTIFQLMLGGFLFLFTIFAGTSNNNGYVPSKLQLDILTFSIYALPLLCFLSAGTVFYLYKNGAGASAYRWYAAPVVATALYTSFVLRLSSLGGG